MAKKTSKNQITLPRSVVDRFPGVSYFDVREEQGQIVLRPVRPDRSAEVRRTLAALGITDGDVDRAVRWARRK
ncbi:MAG: AbrB family transcriptional regulator [Gemmatimonadetes bacterium GWC2_71_10]|nr:MAG: AbrB family transcriptional regulator [Gemmatimonadetes bacterium GWC2_71_10]